MTTSQSRSRGVGRNNLSFYHIEGNAPNHLDCPQGPTMAPIYEPLGDTTYMQTTALL
jgi:hypothetical protein